MNKIIAIDGPAGSGKGTLAKELAKRYNLINIDTGAMYRCVALKSLKENINLEETKKIIDLARDINIDLLTDGTVLLDGENVTKEIRSKEVTEIVSQLSSIKEVREYMVLKQREIAKGKDVVMEGRDITTEVFPDADVKIYLDASIEGRATRRMLERALKGVELSLKETIKEIELRDYKDSTRNHSPLRCAEDAIVIDSTDLSIDEVVSRILLLVNERTKKMSKHTYSEGQNVKGMIVNVTKEAIYLTLNEESKAVIYANDLKGYAEGQKLYNLYFEGQEFEGAIKQIAKDKKTGEDLYILSTKLEDEREQYNLFEEIKEKYWEYLCELPAVSKDSGSYDEAIELTFKKGFQGTVYYTLNGDIPDHKSIKYEKPIKLGNGIHILTAVYENKFGMVSEPVTFEYKITSDIPMSPIVNLASGKYTNAEMIEISIEEGTRVYYTTDLSQPTIESTEYTKPIPMPLGESRFNFIAISETGNSSSITQRNYMLNMKTNVTLEEAETLLVQKLISIGHILDKNGAVQNRYGVFRYFYKFPISEAEINYYVFEEHYMENQINNPLNHFYAVDVLDGNVYKLISDNSGNFTRVEV